MSKAPEWIYLDGDVEAGDGMFPRCFENPKYASEPQVEYVRVDLAEAAEQQGYASAMEDARKLHEARIEELEAKLAKAVEALEECVEEIDAYIQHQYPHDHPVQERHRQRDYASNPARLALAELTGGKDE